MTQRKQITSERRAKQAAKKHSAASKNSGKSPSAPKKTSEKLHISQALYQGTISRAAEKFNPEKGTGFSPYIDPALSARALAPEVKPPPPSKTHRVKIEKPLYGGAFLARIEGKAVFVPLVLPGEQARVRITQSKSAYATAEPEEILASAPHRIAPACPHFGACGGCQYQHTDYAAQLSFKQTILRETLERAGVALPAEIALLSANPWAYRNRIRLAFDAAGNPGYRGRRSHAVVPIAECPIAAPLLLKAALAAAKVARQFVPALRPTEISLFCNPGETALLATIFTANPPKTRFDDFAQALQAEIPEFIGAELIAEGRPGELPAISQWSAPSLVYRAASFDYRVDHGAFFQVNRWLVDALVQKVVANYKGNLAWDLFAGVGLFARQLTASFARVLAVESAQSATAALEANLRGTTGEAVNAETLAFLRRQNLSVKPDLIVVDPPRTGLGAETCALLAEIAAPALAYVSCDPATLARDLRVLTGSGYQIQSVTLADLFPHTFHLETVVHLRRA
jgi:23S rRNA (uracil1939-C5)-methyltransferase